MTNRDRFNAAMHFRPVDHETPPDVSWANFQEYTRLVMSAAQRPQ
jgi:hypothetical protein